MEKELVPPAFELEKLDRKFDDDVERVKELIHRHENHISYEKNAILGMVSVGPNSKPFLQNSLQRIIAQAEEMNHRIDLLVGLNNGVRTGEVLPNLSMLADEVSLLTTDVKKFPAEASQIRNTSGPFLIPNQHNHMNRIFILEQPESAYSAGKIRMLRDMYGLCARSTIHNDSEKAWQPPEHTILFDRESLFWKVQENDTPEPNSNGLKLLMEQLKKDSIDLIGSQTWSCVYRLIGESAEPDVEEPISIRMQLLNHPHIRKNNRILPGGGTLGKTSHVWALGGFIAEKYPGLQAEDLLFTMLASRTSKWGFSPNVTVMNKCGGASDQNEVDQHARWHAVTLDVYEHFSPDRRIERNPRLLDILPTRLEMQLLKYNPHKILKLLYQNAQIMRKASKMRGDLLNGNAHW